MDSQEITELVEEMINGGSIHSVECNGNYENLAKFGWICNTCRIHWKVSSKKQNSGSNLELFPTVCYYCERLTENNWMCGCQCSHKGCNNLGDHYYFNPETGKSMKMIDIELFVSMDYRKIKFKEIN